MKKITTLLVLLTVSFASAQAFKGKDDKKFQIGANIQDGGSGLAASFDYGAGENLSLGFAASYGLSDGTSNLDFTDRFDIKGRFNANIGSVMGLSKKMDIYPGLDLSLKNFGGHVGFRYFFSDGFGLYTEGGLPIARYDKNDLDYNNQPYVNVGISFNFE